MCKKLFVLALVLGLAGPALGYPSYFYDNLLIHYTMDEADSVGGYQLNNAVGPNSIGPIAWGEETFLADSNGYVPGIVGDAVILANDGLLNGGDPCEPFWVPVNTQVGNIIDITPEAESLMQPFENKTISLWFMQTAQRDPALHHPASDGTDYGMDYLLGSYFTYATFIVLKE